MTPRPTPPAGSDLFVGIDVSKDVLDLVRLDQPDSPLRFPNSPDGVQRVVELLRQWNPARIVMESTGKLEFPLLFALLQQQLNACHVNPQRVKEFGRAIGHNAKTDALDALLLARYAKAVGPRVAENKPENQRELAELVSCRRQLIEGRTAHMHQLGRTISRFAQKQLKAVIEELDDRIEKIEEAIANLIDDDDNLKSIDTIIRSFLGAGAVLSATLLAHLSEIGKLNHAPLSALVGLAPFNDDSGKRTGQRHIRGGRAGVRHVLYVCTVVAIRCNAQIKAKYKQLLAQGKHKKVAIIACARKVLRILNAMIRDGVNYQQPNLKSA